MTTNLGEPRSAPTRWAHLNGIAEAVAGAMTPASAAPFVPGVTRIPLSVPNYGVEEVLEALDSLMSGWVTAGKKVKQFEEVWANYIGNAYGNSSPYAVMTNSGSSANLLALSMLRNGGFLDPLKPGDEIITPALTWATTVFPIAQVGCVPVLVDVKPETYNIDPEAIEAAITPKTRAIMPVHLLGNPCDMGAIKDIANRHYLEVIEDACEAHGAEWHGRKVGSFGLLSTFSFFFSHHISTIEGGMIVTRHQDFAETCRSMRAFGWTRELGNQDEISQRYDGIDPRFLFFFPGYNFRPTEIQGAFGIHQVPRLEGFIAQRRENAAYWNRELACYSHWLGLPQEAPRTRHGYFAYPVTVKPGASFSKAALVRYLEKRGLETRPIEAGNIAIQPAMKRLKHRISGDLKNAQCLHDNAFFFGCHSGIGPAEREAVAEYFHEFMRRYR